MIRPWFACIALVLVVAPVVCADHNTAPGAADIAAAAGRLEEAAKSSFYALWSGPHREAARPLVERLDALAREAAGFARMASPGPVDREGARRALEPIRGHVEAIDGMVGEDGHDHGPAPFASVRREPGFGASWPRVRGAVRAIVEVLDHNDPFPGTGLYAALQRYLREYKRYLDAPVGSAEEADARLRYRHYKVEYDRMRATGAMLFGRSHDAFRAYLGAYERYLRAPVGSSAEKVAQVEYPEYKRDFDRLRPTQPLTLDVHEAFEQYLEWYERYLRAPVGSVEEKIANVAFPIYKAEYQARVAQGRTLTHDIHQAFEEYLSWYERYLRAPVGSVDEKVANVAYPVYKAEFERFVSRGEHLFHDRNMAFEAYAQARDQYQRAPVGSTEEKIARVRMEVYRREYTRLGGHV